MNEGEIFPSFPGELRCLQGCSERDTLAYLLSRDVNRVVESKILKRSWGEEEESITSVQPKEADGTTPNTWE